MRTASSHFVLVLTAALALGAGVPGAVGQGADTTLVQGRDDTKAQRLFGELMSPYCAGLTLAACPSPGADSLRQDIRTRLDRGESPKAIRAAYASVWGERILGAPPLRTWGFLLWLTPALLLGLGGAAVAVWLRSVRRRAGGAPGAAVPPSSGSEPPVDPALLKRLEEELAAFDGER